MAFDFKKEYKEFYMPPKKPTIVDVPAMQYVAVRGTGNPNSENGAYQQALHMLYGIAFTIKMSYKGTHQIEGYFRGISCNGRGTSCSDQLAQGVRQALESAK